jgi:hypothetical protein
MSELGSTSQGFTLVSKWIIIEVILVIEDFGIDDSPEK